MFWSLKSFLPQMLHPERKKIRLDEWDYSSEGVYFITICCQGRKLFFGTVHKDKVVFSEIGKIADQFWQAIPSHFPHVKLHEFVIMPNHIHGIVVLDYSLAGQQYGISVLSEHKTKDNFNKFSKPVKKSVSVIINQFKSSVKRWCNQNGYSHFQWQSRFYDHILQDEKSIDRVREYINNNPRNWISDDLYEASST